MKAIRFHQFGGPEVLRLESVADAVPGPGEVLVETRAIGVNPVDTYIRSGIYGPRPLPLTPGLDAAGIIASVGPGVSSLAPGQRVYLYGSVSGTYAEKIIARAAQVHALPERVSFQEGAALGVAYVTAHQALFVRGGAKAGETILIHGASGGVGLAAVQFAKHAGLRVAGTGGTPRGRELVKSQGAEAVFDHTQPGYLEQVLNWTEGKGVDLVIEMLANINLGKDLTLLARRGRVVVVGSRGTVEINPRDTMSRLADIRGLAILALTDEELAPSHEAIAKGLSTGALHPVVGRELPLADAAKAHEAVMASGACGKIVLIP